MKKVFVPILFFLTHSLLGQSLALQNFNYWYDPASEYDFKMLPTRQNDAFVVYYRLTSSRIENPANSYQVSWQTRSTLTERDGAPIAQDSILLNAAGIRLGRITFPVGTAPIYLVAKITGGTDGTTKLFFKLLDLDWPIEAVATTADGGYLFQTVAKGVPLNIAPAGSKAGFFYTSEFNAAHPPFGQAQPLQPFLKADSTFNASAEFTPHKEGLYLLQTDSNSAKGLTLLAVAENFPKYNTIQTLKNPLIYITTSDEFAKLAQAGNNKSIFDQTILEITRDKERAKNLIRSYFQRVETANRFFTSYKEGWKTDRGMIYIIYGTPEQVTRTPETETWTYSALGLTFRFNLSKSIFAPDDFRLERDNAYMESWFKQVDLWRKSRF